jgi:hypothetical protein
VGARQNFPIPDKLPMQAYDRNMEQAEKKKGAVWAGRETGLLFSCIFVRSDILVLNHAERRQPISRQPPCRMLAV